MKWMAYLPVLFAVASLLAQNDANQPGNSSKKHSNSKGDITVQGCVGRSTGYYVLMQFDPGDTYNLEEGNNKIKLGPHLGEQVEVTGWESPVLGTSSSAFYRFPASAATLMVTSIKTVGRRCAAEEFSVSPP